MSCAPSCRGTLFISSLAVFAVFLDTTALFVAFPDITRSFPDVAASQLSWVLNGYTIVFAALLIPSGKLADRRRPQDPVPRRLGRVHRRLGAVADAPGRGR